MTRKLLSLALIVMMMLAIAVPAALGESGSDEYVFNVRDENGDLVAAMDQSFIIQANLKWLDMESTPSGQPYARAVAALKRDRELSLMGHMTFVPKEYLPEYTGGKTGVFAQLALGAPIFAVSGEDQAVILIEEFSKDDMDFSKGITDLYAWLGAALVLADNLSADVRIYQIESVEDDGYTFEPHECFAYEAVYAYLGRSPVWIGDTGMNADLETYVRWFMAQSQIRRMILSEDEAAGAADFMGYLPDENAVLVVTDAEAQKNYVIVKSDEETYALAIMGDFVGDPVTEEMVIEGYVHAIFRQSGCKPEDYQVYSLIWYGDGTLNFTQTTPGVERADQMIDTWIAFAVYNENAILQSISQ